MAHDAVTKSSFMVVLYTEMNATKTSRYRVMYTIENSSWLFPLMPGAGVGGS